MFSWPYVTLTFVALLLSVSRQDESPRNNTQRMCGKRLADMLSNLCSHYGGFAGEVKRRSLRRSSPVGRAYYPLILFKRSIDVDALYGSSAGRSGIVSECCRQPCGVKTLLQYCARPPPNAELDNFMASVKGNPNHYQIFTTNNNGGDMVIGQTSDGGQADNAQSATDSSVASGTTGPKISTFSRSKTFIISLDGAANGPQNLG